ncbi:fatty acid hydroxylase domain-containing protein 2 isoform X1 [Patella vulgata]|uniref:fatty acid hydroxylase domain-containing protein 2 isoform X1 n=2 Tax=Patella vulgata TaxID=6465 RepID=UPI00217FE363|nr:fatty acid hydroxylase domain-containing protein 2 isoform X1 [Patella vulgata]XP_050417709.1 fatty acid hydroxylase domain-containing protein 2 isoform X1 [Patella vulgata]
MVIIRQQLVDSIKKVLFILGSALLVFVAARNSITWHLQKFWGASGDFWQSQWENVYYLLGSKDYMIGIVGTFLITTGIFWISNAFFMLLDLTGRPAFLLRYKIQPDKNVPLEKDALKRAIGVVLFNQTVVGIPFMCVAYLAMTWRGCSMNGELPTFHWVLFEMTVFTLFEELAFYYSHRLFHHRYLYKYIHKRHHEWTASIGLVSIYSHPIEHIFSNLLPPFLGPLLMGCHIATAWLWFCVALMSTTVAHCGYHFPFLPSPEAHDYHHLKFNQNFGVLGVLDRLHGTDNMFRETKAYQRHFLLLGLTPVSQQFPDTPKKKAE